MADLIKRKKKYKKLGQTLKEKALKILMNSGYGSFKQAYFHYQDPRVCELITAYGQYTLKGFANIGEDKVIYGDTDSIYLTSKNEALVTEAAKINVDLEIDKEWKILCLCSNKKQYFGITKQGVLVHKTLTGMKSNQPTYFDKIVRKLMSKEFIESFIPDSGSSNPLDTVIDYVRSAFVQLEEDKEDLAYSIEASKNLYDYASDGKEQEIYRENLEDCNGDVELAQSKSQANNVYEYWKILDENGKSVTIHPERYQLNMDKYREELFNCIEPILEAYGMKEEELDQLWGELIGRNRPKKKADDTVVSIEGCE